MHDEDCCENCIFFVKEEKTSEEEHRMEYPSMESRWIHSALYVRYINPSALSQSPYDHIYRTETTHESYCRKSHTRTPKDKAEWCGEYKAKD